jgi:hypothetical protein
MAGLRAKVIKDSFRSILRVDSDSGLTGSTLVQVEDGDGVNTALLIATDKIAATELKTDTISEQNSASGVTIDGVVVKDNAVTASGGFTGALTGLASSSTTAVTAGVSNTLATPRTIGGASFNGSANIVPNTITVVDAGDDATCSVALFSDATGSLQPKTDPGITYNADTNALATTLITATTVTSTNFAGTLTTAAQANVTSLGTLTNLNVDNINLNTSTIKILTDGGAAGDYCTLAVAANGVTTLSSFDNGLDKSGNINLIADGDIYLRPKAGGGVHLYDSDDSAYVPSHDRHAINKLYADTNYNPKISTPDAITAAAGGTAASLTTLNTEVTTDGDGLDVVTLANGTSGQIKHIYCVVETAGGDSWRIVPATMCGGSRIDFAASSVGLGCTLVYADNEGWVLVGNNGGTVA